MATRGMLGRAAVAVLASGAIVTGSALALSQGGGDRRSDAPGVHAEAAKKTKKKVARGPRGKRGPRGFRGARGIVGPTGSTGATGATGEVGPSSAVAVLDDSSAPFVTISGSNEDASVQVATTQLGAGAWAIHAKLDVSGGSGGARVVCRLLAGTTQLDRSILTAGNVAGYVSQGEMQMMSATTLAASTQIQVRCHREGGTSDPFAYSQQILSVKVGTAVTTRIEF